MPRENQRRGRAKQQRKDKDGGLSTSKEDIKRDIIANNPKPRLPEPQPHQNAEPAQEEEEEEVVQAGSENPWPELDHDSRAYWKQIEGRILELEQIGVGDTEQADDDEEDERKLLLRAALKNLAGQEVALAVDAETSIVLERLLHSMDDYAKRVLGEAFLGQYVQLSQHQFASHVLQTLFALSSDTVDREQRGIKATAPMLRDDADAAAEPSTSTDALPLMSDLLPAAVRELVPATSVLLYHTYGTHLLRTSLLLLSGNPTSNNANDDKLRSKKSKRWKGSMAPMKNLLDDRSVKLASSQAAEEAKKVPKSFKSVLNELRQALDVTLGTGTVARDAAIQPTSCIVVQILLQLEASAGESSKPNSIADRLTGGLMSQPEAVHEPSAYLEASLRESSASHTFETILECAPDVAFRRIWALHFKGHLHKLATHPVANFVIAKAIERLSTEEEIQDVLSEFKQGESVASMLENWRTGPLKALLEKCCSLGCLGSEMTELFLSGLKLGDEQRSLLVPCLLSMTTYSMYTKTPAFGKPEVPNEPSLQGALLLQSWLKLPNPHNTPVIDSLVSIPMDMLLKYTSHPVASRVVDAALDSPSVKPRDRRRLLMHFLGSYHHLADDRLGSRVADHCWAAADVYLKDKIADSLVAHQFALTSSQFGRFFVRKVNLPLHQRRHDDWKAQMANQTTASLTSNGPQQHEKRKKKDEIDALFEQQDDKAAAGGHKAKKAKVDKV